MKMIDRLTDPVRTRMRALGAVALSAALVGSLSGCAGSTSGATANESTASAEEAGTSHALEDLDLTFTSRDKDPSYDAAAATRITLEGNTARVEGAGATADGSTATITDEGTYLVSGTLDDGQVVVDTGSETKVQVVFDGASITNADGPAFYVKNADKCFLTLAEGSVNALADGEQHAEDEDGDDLNAALYSCDDLTINGSGALEVTGSYYHAIKSKDDLVITGGAFAITAAQDGLQGNDCIKIADGTFTVNAGDDAFHSDILLLLEGGTVEVQSCYEGFEAEKVLVNGGDHTIVASDDAVNASLASDDTTSAEATMPGRGTEGAAPGMQAEGAGTPGAQAPEAGVEGAGDAQGMRGGDGRAPDGELPAEPPQGREERDAAPADTASTDLPAQGAMPSDTDRADGPRGAGMEMAASSDACLIRINGGTLRATGGNDALDSNGNVEINGGIVLASGPAQGMDGALDYDLNATINGGTVLLIGDIGSTRGLDQSAQAFETNQLSGAAGSTVRLLAADGSTVAEMVAAYDFNTVLASSPQEGCTVAVA
ncbi:carbohydrate-binding domain-containing protein [Adlercreutzia murintestinalis]|uniref:carbohydrate-binding domain-containing protein n=1 Tax=Adlercreutzia murintestinalis TaxID=2941325 RepID=UPI00203D4873|nr:carbohydrate-binding domain-containing protein [Adlercreutzia murintestinalis]